MDTLKGVGGEGHQVCEAGGGDSGWTARETKDLGLVGGKQEEAVMGLQGAYIMSFPSTSPTSHSPQTGHSTITYAFISLENEVNQGQNNGAELECVQKNPSQLKQGQAWRGRCQFLQITVNLGGVHPSKSINKLREEKAQGHFLLLSAAEEEGFSPDGLTLFLFHGSFPFSFPWLPLSTKLL